MWTIFEVLIEHVIILPLLCTSWFFFFWPGGMWPVLPTQGLNPRPLLWKVKSYPQDHRDVPDLLFREVEMLRK